MAGRRFFILQEPISAIEIEGFMGRVVTLTDDPHTFAPFPPRSPGEPSHNTNDIIPSILPSPSNSTNRKQFLEVVQKKELKIRLTALFGLDFARNKEEMRSLESELVKRYMLSDPEHNFQKLMENKNYADDVRTLLDRNKLHHAYFVTGFLTTTGTLWETEASCTRTNGVQVELPIADLAGIPLNPGLGDFNVNPQATTAGRQKRTMYVAEEEIFAVSYSIVKLSYGLNKWAFPLTKTPVLGRPKRSKAHHLAMGNGEDSDGEIEASSSDDESSDDNGDAAKGKQVDIQLHNDPISTDSDINSSSYIDL